MGDMRVHGQTATVQPNPHRLVFCECCSHNVDRVGGTFGLPPELVEPFFFLQFRVHLHGLPMYAHMRALGVSCGFQNAMFYIHCIGSSTGRSQRALGHLQSTVNEIMEVHSSS